MQLPSQATSVNGEWRSLVLVRATRAEGEDYERQQRLKRIQDIEAAAGFTKVFEMMRDSGKPAVGHNPFFDVCYSMAAFAVERLPPSWEDFKRLSGQWFRGGRQQLEQ